MNYIKGNLLHAVNDGIIIHGCNTTNSPAGGFAGFCFEKYHKALDAHMTYTNSGNSPFESDTAYEGLLGTFSFARVTPNLVVVNGYTQKYPGSGSLSYEAIREMAKKAVASIELGLFNGVPSKIYLPKIGAGIAGGDWNIIEKILDEELSSNYETSVYVLE